MCGLVGAVGQEGAFDQVRPEKIINSLRHRGPDGSGLEQFSGAGWCGWLGSTRLAIIDLSSAGRMPMEDPATGNWIVFNGEVYNFRDIRTELEDFGDSFRSGTDSEVVLKAYAHWGDDCPRRFRGMFAFSIWDRSKSEFFMARDRFGLKPLCYYQGQRGFMFASEVRSLLTSEWFDRRLDPLAVQSYL